MDITLSGWGAHLQELTAQGQWTSDQRNLHVNLLEFLAIQQALRAFLPLIQHKLLLVQKDNTSAMFDRRKQGGTHSLIAQIIWKWAINHKIHLLKEHIPGVEKNFVDLLSRMHQQVHKWEIHPQGLLPYFQLWGFPHIDLFATAQNAK